MPTDVSALCPKRAAKLEPLRHERPREVTMRVRMLTTRQGAPDGIHPQTFEAGKVYDLPPALAEPYIAKKYARQDKMLPGAPETKPAKVPETKANKS